MSTGDFTGFYLEKEINEVHALPSHLFKIYFNIILSPTPSYSELSPSIRLSNQLPASVSIFSHAFYTYRLSHSPSFDYPNNIYFHINLMLSYYTGSFSHVCHLILLDMVSNNIWRLKIVDTKVTHSVILTHFVLTLV